MSEANTTSIIGTASSFSQLQDVRRRDRANVQLIQNVQLIWLDSNIDKSSSDCQDNITHFRRAVNAINIFTNGDECVRFFNDMGNEKACMIISDALCQHILPRVHDLSQIDSIFIFSNKETYHEGWIERWPKIKGVFAEIQPICDALKEAAQRCEQNAVSISIMDASDTLPNKSLDHLDPCFMYTQIMKEILLTIHFEEQHIEEFIQHCRQAVAGNPNELKLIDRLAKAYGDHTPIWWYTLECFLYPMLNRALRTMNVDLMVKLGFFISDLHRQIQQLHHDEVGSRSFKGKFIVYRGQGMEKKELDKMVASEGGLVSFNCFLSTSKTRRVSARFAERALNNPQLVGVLFVMSIDPAVSDTPFASIANVGAMGNQEDEVLFSMNTVFRIGLVKQLDGNPRLFSVELSIASEKDNDLRLLIDRIREETFSKQEEGWFRLGLVLGKMSEAAKAQQIFDMLLKQTVDKNETGPIYHQLGVMTDKLGKYEEAVAYYEEAIKIEEARTSRNPEKIADCYSDLGWTLYSVGDYAKALSSYEKALEIREKSLSATHPDIASCYNRIGLVYDGMGNYPKVLSCYEKALAIWERSLPPTHPNLAACHNNIGNVYDSMGDYPKALSSHERALTIKQQSLPPNHPDLATSYSNIGLVYRSMSEYAKALVSHEKALVIRQQSLSPIHPDLASSYNNIGLVYFMTGDYPRALSALKEALPIQQQSLPSTHPHLASTYTNIGNVYSSMGDYQEALSSHRKSLTIRQQSLSPIHPDLASSYNNIGNVYSSMADYQKALSSYEQALAIRRQSLPSTHLDLATSYNNIGLVYFRTDDFPKALSSHEQALAIRVQSLPPNHPDLATSYNNIGLVYYKIGNFVKALSCHEKALTSRQQSLPSTHPDLASSYYSMGLIQEKRNNYWKAHSFHERAVDIAQRSLSSDHPHLVNCRNNLVRIKRKL